MTKIYLLLAAFLHVAVGQLDPYTGRATFCDSLVIWPPRPILPTINIKHGTRFPRDQVVHDFVTDLEILIEEGRTGDNEEENNDFNGSRRKRNTDVNDLVNKACKDKNSGIDCDKLAKNKNKPDNTDTKTNQPTKSKAKKSRRPRKPSNKVVKRLKEPPFDDPKNKVWDFVEPKNSGDVKPAPDSLGVTTVPFDSKDVVIDPATNKPVSRKKRDVAFSHAFQASSNETGDIGCVPQIELFIWKDLVDYLGEECWILGDFSRKFYHGAKCRSGLCTDEENSFHNQGQCLPSSHTSHFAWFYCPNMQPGERFRKFAFNLAKQCECRLC